MPPITLGLSSTASRTMNWVLAVRMSPRARSSARLCSPGKRLATPACTTRRKLPSAGFAGSTFSVETGKSTRILVWVNAGQPPISRVASRRPSSPIAAEIAAMP